jgi:hypothetical protein
MIPNPEVEVLVKDLMQKKCGVVWWGLDIIAPPFWSHENIESNDSLYSS